MINTVRVTKVQRARQARAKAPSTYGLTAVVPAPAAPWPIFAIGADSGEHAAFALVRLDAEGLRLLGLWPIFGAGVLWFGRAREAAGAAWSALLEAHTAQQQADGPLRCTVVTNGGARVAEAGWLGPHVTRDIVLEQAKAARVWIETPPAHSRKLPNGKRHTQASWIGLGRRVGALQMAWYGASGNAAGLVEPSTWWMPWRGFGIAGGKDQATAGWHRVEEVCALVKGSREALADIPKTRAVDCAESILIAGAAARDLAGVWAPKPVRR